jgi:hypothetical protein
LFPCTTRINGAYGDLSDYLGKRKCHGKSGAQGVMPSKLSDDGVSAAAAQQGQGGECIDVVDVAIGAPPGSDAGAPVHVDTTGFAQGDDDDVDDDYMKVVPTPVITYAPTKWPTKEQQQLITFELPSKSPSSSPTPPTEAPTYQLLTDAPTLMPTTVAPTLEPTTVAPTLEPTVSTSVKVDSLEAQREKALLEEAVAYAEKEAHNAFADASNVAEAAGAHSAWDDDAVNAQAQEAVQEATKKSMFLQSAILETQKKDTENTEQAEQAENAREAAAKASGDGYYTPAPTASPTHSNSRSPTGFPTPIPATKAEQDALAGFLTHTPTSSPTPEPTDVPSAPDRYGYADDDDEDGAGGDASVQSGKAAFTKPGESNRGHDGYYYEGLEETMETKLKKIGTAWTSLSADEKTKLVQGGEYDNAELQTILAYAADAAYDADASADVGGKTSAGTGAAEGAPSPSAEDEAVVPDAVLE